MAKAEQKTKVNDASVEDFLNRVPNPTRREDAFALLKLMKAVTRKPPQMWGTSIVGFGQFHYKYPSGHEGDTCLVGFSPRSQALVLYVMPGFPTREPLLKKLGKHTRGQGCVYIRKLADVDVGVLEQFVTDGYTYMRDTYGPK
jgi:hypothetical protein